MVLGPEAVTTFASVASTAFALLLGARFLLAAQRLGGLAVLRLPGLGFLGLALSAPLTLPAILDSPYGGWHVLHLVLQVASFTAIALGYLLRARHGDSPEREPTIAYHVLLLCAVALLVPFAVLSLTQTSLRAAVTVGHSFTALLVAGVTAHLAASGRTSLNRALVVVGYGWLAASQVFLAAVAVADAGLRSTLFTAANLALVVGLAALLLAMARDARGGSAQ